MDVDDSYFIAGNHGMLDLDADGGDGESEGFAMVLDHTGGVRQLIAVSGPDADQVRGVYDFLVRPDLMWQF